MEEDIDKLEDFLEYNNFLERTDASGDIREFEVYMTKNEFKAIENLIVRYKELKTHYEIICDDLEEHNLIYTDTPEFKENYIQKLKINETIKELQNEIASFNIEYDEFDIWRETFKRKSQIEILEKLKRGDK